MSSICFLCLWSILFYAPLSYSYGESYGESYAENEADSRSLRFNEALLLAAKSPEIVALQARASADQSAAKSAGNLPDPKLFLGLDNVPVTGADRYSTTRDFMSMQRLGVMQEIPNSAKRQAEIDRANATVALDNALVQIRLIGAKRDAGVAWLNLYYREQQLALFNTLYYENTLLENAVHASFISNGGSAVDLLMRKQEAAMLDDQKEEIISASTIDRAELSKWTGENTNVKLMGSPPQFEIDVEKLKKQLHQHPEIAAFEPMKKMLDAELNGAKAMTHPDWGIQASYQKRGSQFDNMASIELSVNLPLFNDSRKQPLIRAKKIELARLQAERDTMLRDHNAELNKDLAENERWKKASVRMQKTVIPLAQQKVELQIAQYSSGKATLSAVINARRELIEARLKAIDIEREQVISAARVMLVYGLNEEGRK